MIMLSHVYQQKSDSDPRNAAIDVENRYLWRMNRRRLEFEALRDSMLMVAGRLDQSRGGLPKNVISTPFVRCRTIYGFIDRQNLPGVFRTFDFASPDTSTPKRHQTTVPQQALYLMNSPFVIEQATHLAFRDEITSAGGLEAGIVRLYGIVCGREPDADEVARGVRFLNIAAGESDQKLGPWVKYAQVLMLANEFAYVD